MSIDWLKLALLRRELCVVVFFVPMFFISSTSVFGQGNSISGHVFGLDRRPIPDVQVELLDDFSRTLQRIRTNSSGRFFFYRVPAG